VSIQELKQVIVVNAELGLPKGKLASQVAHAAVAAFLEATPKAKSAWLAAGMPKVVLKAASEAVLQELQARAQSVGLPVALIQDAGRTVVSEGTVTCVGIGPATAAQLEPLTGDLKLL
jgi:peptidyl-tRNA hydrolase, PTH2 family